MNPTEDATPISDAGPAPATTRLSDQWVTNGHRHFLQPAWDGSGSLRDRFDQVRPYLQDRSVLDVGCLSRFGRDDWLHGLIAGAARTLVGVDLAADDAEPARRAGYDIRTGNAQDFDLGERFDVVFAGELIEHLDDFRGFLASAHRHLGEGGRLVLTTPNPFYIMNFVYRLGGRPAVNAQHTCWLCEDTLVQLLHRNRFEVEELRFIGHSASKPLRRFVAGGVRATLPPRLALDTILAVARPMG